MVTNASDFEGKVKKGGFTGIDGSIGTYMLEVIPGNHLVQHPAQTRLI